MVVSAVIFSASLNLFVALSVPTEIYCTKRIGWVVLVPAWKPITFALTPVVEPVIVTGDVAL